MFASMGETIPPCGVPLNVLWYCHSSTYPACSMSRMRLRNWVSSILFSSIFMSISWSMLSKDSTPYYPCRQLTQCPPGDRDRSRSDPSPLWQAISRGLPPQPPRRAGHLSPGIFTRYRPTPPPPERHPPGGDGEGVHQTHSRGGGGRHRHRSSKWPMAIQPAVLWGRLPEALKQTIASDLTTIVSEVIYVNDTRGATASSPSQSGDLHSP